MNTPSNYKEIEAFAKSINLDVKYLLGEKYEGNIYLCSLTSLPENFNVTVGGNLRLDSLKSLPENYKISLKGDLYINTFGVSKKVIYNKIDVDSIITFEGTNYIHADGILL